MKKARMFIDSGMVVVLPLLMAYSLVGETAHEILGICMGILFIAHHILNIQWYKNLFRGKYTPARILGTVINLALTLTILLQMVSGILVSKHVFVFLKISSGASIGRTIHLLCAYWGFMLMAAHLGMHVHSMAARMGMGRRPGLSRVLRYVFMAVSAYGIYAFIKRDLADYLFMKTAFVFFDYSEPVLLFLADYISIMVLTATVFFYLGRFFSVGRSSVGGKENNKGTIRKNVDERQKDDAMKTEKKKKRRLLLIIIILILAAGSVIFLTMGMPYIRRHFIPVTVNRAQATAMAPVDLGEKKILTVQFTRVGNTDFDDDVAAVSSASLMKENDTLIGNSELLSEMITNAVGGDQYVIRTEKHYPSGYAATCGVAKKELDSGEEIQLLDDIPDTSAYDTVFLVYPIWWGTVPKAVEAFLKNADLSHAVIYTVVTHGGRKEGSCIRDMKSMTNGTVSDKYLTVYDDEADTARDQVAAWLSAL